MNNHNKIVSIQMGIIMSLYDFLCINKKKVLFQDVQKPPKAMPRGHCFGMAFWRHRFWPVKNGGIFFEFLNLMSELWSEHQFFKRSAVLCEYFNAIFRNDIWPSRLNLICINLT